MVLKPRRIRMLAAGLARPRRVWPLDLLPVHEDLLHSLLEERDEPRDRFHKRQRLWVIPGDIGIDLLAHAQRPIRRFALVGALALGLTRLQQIHAHILDWDVVAHRQTCLEDELRSSRLGYGHARMLDAHLATALACVDQFIRVARMGEGALLLLIPGVHLVPVEGHMTSEVWTIRWRRIVAPCHILCDT